MPISMRQCRAISVAAAPTTVFVRRSSMPRRRLDMSQGLLEASHALQSDVPEVSRRTFFKLGMTLGAAVGGGLLLGFSVPVAASQRAVNAGNAGKGGRGVKIGDASRSPQADVLAPNAFIRIDRQGGVTLIMPKVEMGQGVYTAIPMLIAEELEVPLEQVALDHAPPNAKLYGDPLLGGGQITGGSTSIRYAWQPMRQAGATARALLVAAAAQRWKVETVACCAQQGAVVHTASGRRIGYGELVDVAAKMPLPTDVK